MKKSIWRIVIIAVVLMVVGIGLICGGIFAMGGVAAARDAVIGNDIDEIIDFEFDEDGFDIDFEIENGNVRVNVK